MSNLTQEIALMHQNKSDIVKALNEVGITEATDDTPLSELALLAQWGAGFGGCHLAVLGKVDSTTLGVEKDKQYFYSKEQWDGLSTNVKAALVIIGLRVRAEGKQFIIAKSNPAGQSDDSTTRYAWTANAQLIPDVDQYVSGDGGDGFGLLSNFRGLENTRAIVEWAAAKSNSHPAAEAAWNYKAATLAADGYADPTQWFMGTVAHFRIISTYKAKINEALSALQMPLIASANYWTCIQSNSYLLAWTCVPGGALYTYGKNPTYCVRPLAAVAAPSATETL